MVLRPELTISHTSPSKYHKSIPTILQSPAHATASITELNVPTTPQLQHPDIPSNNPRDLRHRITRRRPRRKRQCLLHNRPFVSAQMDNLRPRSPRIPQDPNIRVLRLRALPRLQHSLHHDPSLGLPPLALPAPARNILLPRPVVGARSSGMAGRRRGVDICGAREL